MLHVPVVQAPDVGLDDADACLRRRQRLHKAAPRMLVLVLATYDLGSPQACERMHMHHSRIDTIKVMDIDTSVDTETIRNTGYLLAKGQLSGSCQADCD